MIVLKVTKKQSFNPVDDTFLEKPQRLGWEKGWGKLTPLPQVF